MLTAHVPFASNTDFRVLTDHVNTPPPLPTTFYPYIPKGIENVVLKALEKNPDDRFQNVEEFGSALEHPELWESYVPKFSLIPGAAAAAGATPVPYDPSAPTYAGAGQTYRRTHTAGRSTWHSEFSSAADWTGNSHCQTPPPLVARVGRKFPTKLVAGLGGLLLVALAALGFLFMHPKQSAPVERADRGKYDGCDEHKSQ